MASEWGWVIWLVKQVEDEWVVERQKICEKTWHARSSKHEDRGRLAWWTFQPDLHKGSLSCQMQSYCSIPGLDGTGMYVMPTRRSAKRIARKLNKEIES